MYLLRTQHLGRIDLPGIQDFTPQRHDRLCAPVARLLGRSARGVPLDEEQLGFFQVLAGAIRQLARQGRTGGNLFALDRAGFLQALLGIADRHLRYFFGVCDVLVQPQADRVLARDLHQLRHLPAREAVLGLAAKLGLFDPNRQDVGALSPDIVR